MLASGIECATGNLEPLSLSASTTNLKLVTSMLRSNMKHTNSGPSSKGSTYNCAKALALYRSSEGFKNSTSSGESSSLRHITDDLVSKLKAEAGERAALQQQLLDAQVKAVEASMAAEEAIVQLEAVREERAALEAKAEIQGANLELLESRLSRAWNEVQAISAAAQSAKAARDALLDERNQLAAQLDQLQQQQQGAAEAAVATQQEDAARSSAAAASREQALQQALQQSLDKEAQTAQSLDALIKQLSQAQTQLADLQQAKETASTVAAMLRQQLSDASLTQESLEAQLYNVHAENASSNSVTEEQASYEVDKQALTKQLQLSERSREQVTQQLESAQKQIVDLKAQVQAATDERSEVKVHMDKLESELTEVAQQLQQTREDLARVNAELFQSKVDQEAAQKLQEAAVNDALQKQRQDMQAIAQQQKAQLQEERLKLEKALQQEKQKVDLLEASKLQNEAEAMLQQSVTEAATIVQTADVQTASTSEVQLHTKLRITEMQLASSERERQLELGVLITNYTIAREQGNTALATVRQLQSELADLRAISTDLIAEQKQRAHAAHEEAELARHHAAATQEKLVETEKKLSTALQRLQQAEAAAQQAQQAQQQLSSDLEQARALQQQAQSEAQELGVRLKTTEAWIAQRVAAQQALRPTALSQPSALPTDAHTNTNKFFVPASEMFDLIKALAVREASLWSIQGFMGMKVEVTSSEQVAVTTQWASKEAYESWVVSGEGKLAGLPASTRQYAAQKKGAGIPESYVPFVTSS